MHTPSALAVFDPTFLGWSPPSGGEFLVSPDDRGERGGHDKVDYATNRRGDLIGSRETSNRRITRTAQSL